MFSTYSIHFSHKLLKLFCPSHHKNISPCASTLMSFSKLLTLIYLKIFTLMNLTVAVLVLAAVVSNKHWDMCSYAKLDIMKEGFPTEFVIRIIKIEIQSLHIYSFGHTHQRHVKSLTSTTVDSVLYLWCFNVRDCSPCTQWYRCHGGTIIIYQRFICFKANSSSRTCLNTNSRMKRPVFFQLIANFLSPTVLSKTY